MAGKVVADQIEDSSANVGSTTDMIKGSAKAWVHFDASSGTPIIGDSHNVTSITDEGVGIYTVNITNALASTNLCTLMSQGGAVNQRGGETWMLTTSTVKIICTQGDGSSVGYDAIDASMAVIG